MVSGVFIKSCLLWSRNNPRFSIPVYPKILRHAHMIVNKVPPYFSKVLINRLIPVTLRLLTKFSETSAIQSMLVTIIRERVLDFD